MTKQTHTTNPSIPDALRLELARLRAVFDVAAAMNSADLFGTTEGIVFLELFLAMARVEKALKGRRG